MQTIESDLIIKTYGSVLTNWSNINNAFNVTRSVESGNGKTADQMKQLLITLLGSHPEGVCVIFPEDDPLNSHTIVFLSYDSTKEDFIVCDPGTESTSEGFRVYFSDSYSGDKRSLGNIDRIVTYTKNN